MANNENVTFTELNKHKVLDNSNVIYQLEICGPQENHYIVVPKESTHAGNLYVMKKGHNLHLKLITMMSIQTSFQLDQAKGIIHYKC